MATLPCRNARLSCGRRFGPYIGNKYLRRQLIHGARAALPIWPSATRRLPVGQKADEQDPSHCRGRRLGNKLARFAWAVLKRGKPFEARAVSVAA